MYFVFPPRPHTEIPPTHLSSYDNGQWVAQFKYNGTRTQIHIRSDRSIRDFERRGKPHSAYLMGHGMKRDLLSLDIAVALEDGGVVLDGEVLHSKTKTLKDTIVLYDVLWWKGKYLYGTTVKQRLELLDSICRRPTKMDVNGRALMVTPTLWMAPTFTTDFVSKFTEALDDDAREGLVLKLLNAPLKNLGGGSPESNDVTWQVKCRKPHKNYQF
jgi:ATP-dependent DNA ligase